MTEDEESQSVFPDRGSNASACFRGSDLLTDFPVGFDFAGRNLDYGLPSLD